MGMGKSIHRKRLDAAEGSAVQGISATLRAAGTFFLLLLLAACGQVSVETTSTSTSTSFPPTISLRPVAAGFVQPVGITHAGDGSGRLFIVEQGGRIRIFQNNFIKAVPFLDISSLVTAAVGEQGLLGLAFPPGYSTRGEFYVNYTDRTGVGNTIVARYGLTANANVADPLSRQELLTIVQPFTNHNGGQLAFGPDGFLYIGTGDGGSVGDPLGNAQSLASLLGKVLRIDVLSGAVPYAIPLGNPFGDEIWAYGLRNPWRFSFDRQTGDFYLADVGEAAVEEVDFQPAGSGAGANYGWNIMEGSRCFLTPVCSRTGLTLPVAEYPHGSGDCSIAGGYVYRGSSAALQGIYFYGDFCSGRIWGLRQTATGIKTELLIDTALAISTFGEDEAGELYVADYLTGSIFRITAP
ncbi:MAG: PQQ-dependent sugar dehydrogenase [Deltaproteobacteria bacterium]|nr:PQQ-dependent sugar dehydrogenase [Deltaproteobacteria bacterium]